MNKKLFGTLLLGSLLMGGTFVSCKDYDDDIENLQGQISGVESQITDVKALVAQLQSKLDGMTYVQSVTKSSDGQTIKFTMSNGQTVEFTNTVSDPGSVVTVEDGVLCIDGEPTEIKVASAINMPKVENGQIYIFDEETGEYAATGIFINQNTVVESATKYTITMTTSDGTTATFDVPKASGLITEIKVAPNWTINGVNEYAYLGVAQYTVANTMNNWPGTKPALKKGNIVFGFSKTLNIRVNPVAVDLKGVEFKLVDTKNNELPSVTLKAKPEDGQNAIPLWNINTRANEGNGLWTLYSDNVVIEKSGNNTLDKKLNNYVAYAVTAGSARSAYCVGVLNLTAPTLKNVYFDKNNVAASEKSTIGGAEGKTVLDLNKAYTIVADDDMALYDVYMSVDALDKETFGIEIDNATRTIKYTKQPDLVTTNDVYFWVNVKTADNEGTVKDSKIKVMMSSKIGSGANYDPVNYDLAQLVVDNNPNNDAFVVSLAAMKTALGSEYTRWANNVDLNNIGVTYYTNEACTEGAVVANGTNAPNAIALNDEYDPTTTTKSNVSLLYFAVNANQNALKIGKQYYAKITFNNSTPSEINSIVIPVKFTAPTVADQFTAKAGYVVDGVINAYFYNVDMNDVNRNSVTLSRYFDAKDGNAALSLKNDDKLVKIGNNDYNSSDLAAFVNGTNDVTDNLKLANVWVPGAATEAGYGKVLTVNAVNSKYASTSWSYDAEADTKASFQIKIMSPIYQGTIKPAEGASVKLVANNVDGSNITSEMIVATDYTGTNKIEIMPDQAGNPLTADVWKNPQIVKMTATKDPSNTYIFDPTINAYKAATANTPAVLGSINVKADPVSNDVDTHIYVNVTDAWGYTNTVKLPVTITKQ